MASPTSLPPDRRDEIVKPDSRLRRIARDPRFILLVALFGVVSGIVLRLQSLGFPPILTFDEVHFVVKGGRAYLAGARDTNQHPPLGKLFVAASMWLFGDHSLAWRLPSALFGLLNIGLAGALAWVAYRDRMIAVVAMMFLAIDGFFMAYSRTACIDAGLVTWMLLSAIFLVRRRGVGDLFLACLFAGLCTSVKFTGVVLLPAIAVAMVVGRERLPLWAPLVCLVYPAVYWAVYRLGLHLSNESVSVWGETARIYRIHNELTHWKNPYVTPWWEWLLPARTMPLHLERVDPTHLRVMTSLPNLAIHWGSLVALASVGLGWVSRRAGLSGPLRTDEPGWWHADLGPSLWLTFLWFLPMAPWLISNRDSYYNHYLPSYAFAVVLCAAALVRSWQRRPALGASGLVTVVVVYLLYAPLQASLVVPDPYYEILLPAYGWRGGIEPDSSKPRPAQKKPRRNKAGRKKVTPRGDESPARRPPGGRHR